MEIKIKKFRDIYILLLEGELDLYNAPRIEGTFTALTEKGIKKLIIDFDKVNYIDSSGIGVLLKLKSLTSGRGLNFMLSGVSGEVRNVLKLTNLIQFFSIADNLHKGLKELSSGAENSDEPKNKEF